MKKFWKIRNTPDIRNCLETHLTKEYTNILLATKSNFYKNIKKFDYAFICYTDDGNYHQNDNGIYRSYCWSAPENFDWLISEGFKYCGEINLRKEKLLKLMS